MRIRYYEDESLNRPDLREALNELARKFFEEDTPDDMTLEDYLKLHATEEMLEWRKKTEEEDAKFKKLGIIIN